MPTSLVGLAQAGRPSDAGEGAVNREGFDRKLVPPAGLDAAVFNYLTAYQMLHRSVKARPGQRMLIHGGLGWRRLRDVAVVKAGRRRDVRNVLPQAAAVVREMGRIPIDYKNADFV